MACFWQGVLKPLHFITVITGKVIPMKKLILPLAFMAFGLLFLSSDVAAQVFVRIRPIAPVVIGVRPPCPSPRHVWVAGHWRWNKQRGEYVWVEGHWIKGRRGAVWVDGHWEDVPGQGSRWIQGHWR
jgi:hypothetical protein